MSWDSDLEARLRRYYCLPDTCPTRSEQPQPVATAAGSGFVTEIAGKVILTAPAGVVAVADELPDTMRARWETASAANPYYLWLQGRFVEADKANANGHFWSTADLQFGEMSVKHGPLNWLHNAHQIIGTIADNQLITPAAPTPVQTASTTTGDAVYVGDPNSTTATWTPLGGTPIGFIPQTAARPRPYIAAVSAVWKYLFREKAHAVEAASDAGNLYYSMEAISREMACETDGDRVGCGQSYPYLQVVTQPETVCEHIRAKSCARRMVDPSFLGGAIIVPPVQPGWGEARAEVMRQASALAEQVAPVDASASDWERLMASVIAYAVMS